MYKFLIIFLISLVSVGDSENLEWRSDYKLEWSDFKGSPKNSKSIVAVTASGITFSYTTKRSEKDLIDFKYEVKAHFYPEKSWFNKSRVNEVHLNHERLHFDITELHARKFRQMVSNTRFTNKIRSEMNTIYDFINKELETMQERYDSESHHSINRDKQKAWENYVALELEKLSNYR